MILARVRHLLRVCSTQRTGRMMQCGKSHHTIPSTPFPLQLTKAGSACTVYELCCVPSIMTFALAIASGES